MEDVFLLPSYSQPNFVMENVGERLCTFEVPFNAQATSTNIKNVKAVASYNWLKQTDMIAVPGSPRIWNEPKLPKDLKPDRGTSYIDQNGNRRPGAPMEPLFLAVRHLKPGYRFQDLDLITDRNSLRKLLRFVTSTADLKDFRINAIRKDKTIVFVRNEKRTVQKSSGFGNNHGLAFEKVSTGSEKGLEKSTGHHRIISYDFAGVRCLVRFEVDACLWTPKAVLPPINANPAYDLFSSVESLGAHQQTSLAIHSVGRLVPQRQILELATRTKNSTNSTRFSEWYGQLLLSQTPHLYLGLHHIHTFTKVDKLSVSEVRSKADPQIDVALRKLRKLLDDILAFMLSRAENQTVLICEQGVLSAYECSDSAIRFDASVDRFFP